MRRQTVAAVGVSALLLLGAACGGSKHTDAQTTTTDASTETSAPASTDTSTDPSTTGTVSDDGSRGGSAATTTTATTGPVASGDFAAQANAMCKRFADESSAIELPTDDSPAATGAYFAKAIVVLRRQVDELRTLTPPADQAEKWGAILSTLDGALAKLDALIPRLAAGDDSAMGEVETALDSDDINAKFDGMGLLDCGSGSGG